MNERDAGAANQGGQEPQPVFLLPMAVTMLAGFIIAVHLAATYVLNPQGQETLTIWFAFIPSRAYYVDAGGWMPHLWTPFTHAFLHAGFDHLLINMAWLVIFATPVARRYGGPLCFVLFLISAAAGAGAFAITSFFEPSEAPQILVGASGGVAGLTGAAVRFMFQPVLFGAHPETGERIVLGRQLASLREVAAVSRMRNFVLLWVVLNAAVPLLPLLTGGAGVVVAWQAHLGGFLAGLLLVRLLERRGN